MGGGADSQTFGDIYQPLFFSTKVPKCGWGSQNPKPNPNFGWNLLNAFNNSQINKYIMPVIIAGTMFHIVLSAQMSKYNFKFHKIFVDI